MPISIAESSRLADRLLGLQVAIQAGVDASTVNLFCSYKASINCTIGIDCTCLHVVRTRAEPTMCTIRVSSAQEHLTFVRARFVSSALLRAVAMLGALAKYFSSVSQIRKLLFTLVYLPKDVLDHWEVA